MLSGRSLLFHVGIVACPECDCLSADAGVVGQVG
jgi:hypothetical protein